MVFESAEDKDFEFLKEPPEFIKLLEIYGPGLERIKKYFQSIDYVLYNDIDK